MDELEAILETGAVAAVEVAASAMAERGEDVPPCPSCKKPLIGAYCAVCGQPRNTHRRTLGKLIHEFVKDVVSFDSRILRTGKALLLRPGELPASFREGRTQPYVPAVRLYLFVSLLFFLFLSASGIGLIQFNMNVQHYKLVHDEAGKVYKIVDGKKALLEGLKSDAKGVVRVETGSDAENGAIKTGMIADGRMRSTVSDSLTFFHRKQGAVPNVPPSELEKALEDSSINIRVNGKKSTEIENSVIGTLKKLRSDPGALNEPLTTWIPRILFVLLPLFAILLALFYRRQRKDYLFVDHLVFSLNMHTFAFVALIGAALLAQVLSGDWVAKIFMVVASLYFFLALKTFYRQGWIKTSIKFVCISFVYFVFFLCPALVFALVASVIWA